MQKKRENRLSEQGDFLNISKIFHHLVVLKVLLFFDLV